MARRLFIIGVLWISGLVSVSPDMSGLQSKLHDLNVNMVIITLSTTILFTSLDSLVSASIKNEETAASLSK